MLSVKSDYNNLKLPTPTQFSGLPSENFEDWGTTFKLNLSPHAVDELMTWTGQQNKLSRSLRL